MPSDSASLAAPAVATRTKSSTSVATQGDGGYPAGHLGHLNERQSTALTKFRGLLEERGIYKRGPPPSHDDALLLRFLRARRWVIEDAYKQLKDTEDWRAANDIDVLYNTIDLESYDQSRKLYPQWTGRRDRRGIPLYVFVIQPLNNKTIQKYEKQGKSKSFSEAKTDGNTPPGLLRLFALYENLTRFNTPFCTQLVADRDFSDVPITMSTNIVDISGVGLKQFWDLKSHMQAASTLATAHYPETLDRIFIIGAPRFFSTVWSWIKSWFDPVTVAKIFILGPHETLPTLEAFIDPSNIPKKYGGQLQYEFGDLPVIDPAWEGIVKWENGHEAFPTGPLFWRDLEGGKAMQCIAIGSVNGEKRNEVVCTMPKILDINDYERRDAGPTDSVPASTLQEAPGAALEPTTESKEGISVAAVMPNGSTTTTTAASSERTAREEVMQPNVSVTDGSAMEKLKIEDEKRDTVLPATQPTAV